VRGEERDVGTAAPAAVALGGGTQRDDERSARKRSRRTSRSRSRFAPFAQNPRRPAGGP
jgi:hypothetical protein